MVVNIEINYTVKPGKRPPKSLDGLLRSWQDATWGRLGAIPGPVHYPIRWTSERQRRAFFASDGFGRGIPTKRTGLVARWDVHVDYDALETMRSWLFQLQVFLATLAHKARSTLGSSPKDIILIAITNTIPYQRYVTGENQQGFHRDTGWVYAPTEIDSAVQEVEGILTEVGLL